MALNNVPKTNYTTDDGVISDDLNNIGLNLNSLDDGKYESGDSPSFVDITATGAATIAGAINPTTSPTDSSQVVGSGSAWVPPRGVYMITGASDITVTANMSAAWRNIFPAGTGGMIFTDGTNVRVNNGSGGNLTVYYLKF